MVGEVYHTSMLIREFSFFTDISKNDCLAKDLEVIKLKILFFIFQINDWGILYKVYVM